MEAGAGTTASGCGTVSSITVSGWESRATPRAGLPGMASLPANTHPQQPRPGGNYLRPPHLQQVGERAASHHILGRAPVCQACGCRQRRQHAVNPGKHTALQVGKQAGSFVRRKQAACCDGAGHSSLGRQCQAPCIISCPSRAQPACPPAMPPARQPALLTCGCRTSSLNTLPTSMAAIPR